MYSGEEIEPVGKRLFKEGLVSGNFGNISVRNENEFLITRRGAFLDEPGKYVHVPFTGEIPPDASSEYRAHREIYLCGSAKAIVHAHPPCTVAASLNFEEILPEDSEGAMLCPLVPVVRGEPGTEELAHAVAEALKKHHVAVARGHGTFAASKTLKEAYILTSALEFSCRILHYSGGFGGLSR